LEGWEFYISLPVLLPLTPKRIPLAEQPPNPQPGLAEGGREGEPGEEEPGEEPEGEPDQEGLTPEVTRKVPEMSLILEEPFLTIPAIKLVLVGIKSGVPMLEEPRITELLETRRETRI
jgi:hypothetical protein